MKQLASVGLNPQPLDYESNTLPTEPHDTLTIQMFILRPGQWDSEDI